MTRYKDQPQELREYLLEAEAIVMEWYSRDGVDAAHEADFELMAVMAVHRIVNSSEMTFRALMRTVKVYLAAAFRMGRAGDGMEWSHDANLERIATLLAIDTVIREATFRDLVKAAQIYLTAAFQMGRAAADGNDCSNPE